MATKVHMEALSPTMEEGQLVRWLKNEGDAVKEGEVLAEIETDKATMELVARGSGVLRKRALEEGQTAPVGAVIGVIAAPDEDISGLVPAAAEAPAGAPPAGREMAAAGAQPAPPEKVEPEKAARVAPAGAEAAPPPAPAPRPEAPARAAPAPERAQPAGGGVAVEGGRVRASPLARRLAAEAGLELTGVEGSGPGGRITKRDIESARARPAAPAAAPPPAAAPAAVAPAPVGREAAAVPSFMAAPLRARAERPEVEEVPASQMRKSIARRLVTSIGPVPTFYLTIEVDMTRTMAARERLNARVGDQGQKASVNDFLIKAVAEALRRHPEVNASWGDTVIRRYGRVHLGVAVAVEDGLISPVVHDADLKGVLQIAAEVRQLAARARERKLTPEEYTGSTFSVSNLGMLGIDEFTAIINPPESGIVAVGRVEEKPTVVDAQVVVQPRMRVTMSCDHRVVDGATGARFLQTLRDFLEEPALMLA